MKKRCKILLSCLVTLTLLLSMTANCLAANSLTITKVEVLDGSGGAERVKETYTPTDGQWPSIGVQVSAEVIRITGKITDASGAAVSGAAATILVNDVACDAEGSALDNSTIQYIDQVSTNADGTVSFTYRNRTTIGTNGLGSYNVKLGGTDVATVASVAYAVEADLPILSVTGTGKFEQATAPADGLAFTLSVNTGDLPGAVTVKLNGEAKEATYAGGVVTISKTVLDTLAYGNYDLRIEAEGYNEAFSANAIVVDYKTLTDEQKAEAAAGLEAAEATVSGGTVTFPDAVAGAASGITCDIAETDKTKVAISGNTVTLKEGQPFAKVDVEISVNGSDLQKTQTVYLIPENTPVSFGNLGLHTITSGGQVTDAFAYDPEADETAANAAFTSFVTEPTNAAAILEDVAVALSIAMDNSKAAAYDHFGDALDFNKDGAFSLAEYRIYRLMMKGNDPVHTFTAVNKAR